MRPTIPALKKVADVLERSRTIAAGVADFLWFLLRWTLMLAVVCAVLVGIYLYNRVDDEIRTRIETILARHYAGLTVSVRSARLLNGGGGVQVRGLSISQQGPEASRTELAYFDEILVLCNPTLRGVLAERDFDVKQIVIRRPSLRTVRGADGSWSLNQLFPLPRFGKKSPPARIEDGSLEIIDQLQQPASHLVCRHVDLALRSANLQSSAPRLRVDGTFRSDHVQSGEIHGILYPVTGKWQVDGQVVKLAISPELRRTLPVELSERMEFLRGFHGLATLKFSIQSGQSGAPAVYEVSGAITAGVIQDVQLAYPLVDLRADVAFNNRLLHVTNLEARYGPAIVQLDLHRQGHQFDSPLSVNGTAKDLRVDKGLIDLLPSRLEPVWQFFRPVGTMDLAFRVDFDGQRWDPELTAHCRELSVTYSKFPYPLKKVVGSLSLKNGTLRFERCRGLADQTWVEINGVVHQPGANWSGWVNVQTRGHVPIDRQLIDAQPEGTRRIVSQMRLRGWTAVTARFERAQLPDAPLKKEIDITLRDGSLQSDVFRYPFDRVNGTIKIRNDEMWFNDFVGQNDGTRVTCDGQWTRSGGDDGRLRLNFDAQHVLLDDELRDALSPGARTMWNKLRPRGTIARAVVSYDRPSRDERARIALWLQQRRHGTHGPSTISFKPEGFPYRLDQVTGEVRFADGNISFHDLYARHGADRLSGNGHSQIGSDGAWQLEFSRLVIDGLPIDRDLYQAMPARLREALKSLNPTGPVNIDGSLTLANTGRIGAPVSATWDAHVTMVNGSVGSVLPLDDITGRIRLWGKSDGRRFHSRGELSVDSLFYKGVQFSQVHGPMWLDDASLQLGSVSDRNTVGEGASQPIRARVFGGAVEGDARVEFDKGGTFSLQAKLADADLSEVVQATSRRPPPVKGRAYGVFELSGTGRGTDTFRGSGRIGLREADIYKLPLTVSLLKVLRAESPDSTAFTTSDIDFGIHGDRIHCSRIDLSGDAISLKGRGYFNLQRQINFQFYSLVGRETDYLPAILPFVGEASRQLLQINVTGTLDKPQTVQKVLPELNETLQSWFPESAQRSQAPRIRPFEAWNWRNPLGVLPKKDTETMIR